MEAEIGNVTCKIKKIWNLIGINTIQIGLIDQEPFRKLRQAIRKRESDRQPFGDDMQRRPPSEKMMHLLLFKIPPYFGKNFSLSGKFSNFYLFPKICSFLGVPKFLTTLFLLVIDCKFWISPKLFLFQYISPLFRENYYFPSTFKNSAFPFFFINLYVFYMHYVYFASPPPLWPWFSNASHNACPERPGYMATV